MWRLSRCWFRGACDVFQDEIGREDSGAETVGDPGLRAVLWFLHFSEAVLSGTAGEPHDPNRLCEGVQHEDVEGTWGVDKESEDAARKREQAREIEGNK